MDGKDSDMLLEGDDDLLNYFLEPSDQLGNVGNIFDSVDEVNSGMASLLYGGTTPVLENDNKLQQFDDRDRGGQMFSDDLKDSSAFFGHPDGDDFLAHGEGGVFGLKNELLDSVMEPVSPATPQYASITPEEIKFAPTPARATRAPKTTKSRTPTGMSSGTTQRITKPRQPKSAPKVKTEKLAAASAMSVAAVPMADMSTRPGAIKGEADEFGEGGMPESEEKRQRRLARNRESARQSRRRKKQYLELLEEKVSALTKEIDDLRRDHLEKCSTSLEYERHRMLKQLLSDYQAKQSMNPEDDLRAGIILLERRFGSDSNERRLVLDYHYQQLMNLLMPPYTKFLLWMMNQGEDFFVDKPMEKTKARGVSGLWPLVSAELGLTGEQQEKLKQNYKAQDTNALREECIKLNRCIKCLDALRKGIDTRATAVHAQSEALHKILTPEQSAIYLNWVAKNRQRLRNCGMDEDMTLTVGLNQSFSLGAKFDHAVTVLKKPDAELQLDDIESLLGILEG